MNARRTAQIACLTVGMLPALFAGTAFGQVRSGSVADELGDSTTGVTGVRVADVKSVEASYDQAKGTLNVTFQLSSPLPPAFSVSVRADIAQSYDKTNICLPRERPGDVSVTGSFVRFSEGGVLYGGESIEGNGIALSSGTRSATPDSVTMSFTGAALVGLDYRCVTRLTFSIFAGGVTSADSVRDFSLTPPGPPPPVVNPVTGPLRVSWTTPKARETVSGYLWSPRALPGAKLCEVKVTTPAGVDHVDFSVNGRFLNREYNAPYRCIWDTRTVPDGQHALTATAYDKAGRTTIATIGLNVRNAGRTTVVTPPELPPGVVLAPLAVTPGQAIAPTPVPAAPGAVPQPTAPPRAGSNSPDDSSTRSAARARVSFAVLTKSLRSVRAGGLLVPMRCSTGCRISLRLVRGRKVVGTGRGALSRRGRRVVTVRLTRNGRRALRRVRRGAFVVRGTVRYSNGNLIRIQRRIRLGR